MTHETAFFIFLGIAAFVVTLIVVYALWTGISHD
jgi:ABC-type lipoprotein release transport system permease subunit